MCTPETSAATTRLGEVAAAAGAGFGTSLTPDLSAAYAMVADDLAVGGKHAGGLALAIWKCTLRWTTVSRLTVGLHPF